MRIILKIIISTSVVLVYKAQMKLPVLTRHARILQGIVLRGPSTMTWEVWSKISQVGFRYLYGLLLMLELDYTE